MLVRRLKAGPKLADRDNLLFAEADSARLRRIGPDELIEEAEALFERVHREYNVPESFLLDLRETAERDLPKERSLVKRLEGKPFVLLGINGDEDREQAKKVAEQKRITWRSWWDGSPPGPIAKAWNVTGWPTLYLLDQEGIIRFKCVDYDERGLMEALGLLLKASVEERREGE